MRSLIAVAVTLASQLQRAAASDITLSTPYFDVELGPPYQLVVDTLPDVMSAELARAVHRRIRHCFVLAAPQVEAAISHRALDDHHARLDRQWLQEEDAAKSRTARHRRARELQIASPGEDDTTLHDVVRNDSVKRARDG